MAASGSAAGRPLSSTRTDPGVAPAPSALVTLVAGSAVLATPVPVTPVPVTPVPGPAGSARRRACAATAAAEPRVTTPGTAAAIRLPTSPYSVQPSTTAWHPAGVLAAALAIAAAIAASSPASTASARPGQATGVTSAEPPNSAISLRWYGLCVVATVAQMATEW